MLWRYSVYHAHHLSLVSVIRIHPLVTMTVHTKFHPSIHPILEVFQSGSKRWTNRATDWHCHSYSSAASLAKNGMINTSCIQMEMGLRVGDIWRVSRCAKEIGKGSDYRWISTIENGIQLTYHLHLRSDQALVFMSLTLYFLHAGKWLVFTFMKRMTDTLGPWAKTFSFFHLLILSTLHLC